MKIPKWAWYVLGAALVAAQVWHWMAMGQVYERVKLMSGDAEEPPA